MILLTINNETIFNYLYGMVYKELYKNLGFLSIYDFARYIEQDVDEDLYDIVNDVIGVSFCQSVRRDCFERC